VIFFSLTRGDVRMFCHCFSITASSWYPFPTDLLEALVAVVEKRKKSFTLKKGTPTLLLQELSTN
jgi:hypothetical protein